ncbi:ABC transporter permease [Halobacteriales archaeon QS_8_69_26]|nr:MAG: ABC transporter permease [Halobacteriales archaeon QS_8_69_26]
MTREVLRYEGRRRLKGSVYLGVGLGLFALLFAPFYPAVKESGEQLQEYVENLPPAIRAAFGLDAFTTIEGFLATEFYAFAWVLLLGVYLAYRAGGAVAGDVESGRIDMVLSAPVSRAGVVLGTVGSLLVPIAVCNLLVPPAVYATVLLAGETIAVPRLLAVHALSVPYFLACVGIGTVLSVAVGRASVAERGAIAAVFGLFLVDTLTTTDPDLEPVGAVSPTRHYDPTAVLVRAEYDLVGAGVLLAGTVALVAVAVVVFRRRDLT